MRNDDLIKLGIVEIPVMRAFYNGSAVVPSPIDWQNQTLA
jgi:hypothetical protein